MLETILFLLLVVALASSVTAWHKRRIADQTRERVRRKLDGERFEGQLANAKPQSVASRLAMALAALGAILLIAAALTGLLGALFNMLATVQ